MVEGGARKRIDMDLRGGWCPADAERMASLLRNGHVGVVPTDTVYGVAAFALDHGAVERVIRLKERAPDSPLPLQVPGIEEAGRLADLRGDEASALMTGFWPGAVTLVLPARADIEIPFQGDTVGIRVPDHGLMLDVLDLCWPLVVPSANPPGGPAPRSIGEVAPSILDAVDFVVDLGPSPGGVESSVVDVTRGVRVLREGALSRGQIEGAVAGKCRREGERPHPGGGVHRDSLPPAGEVPGRGGGS